MLLRCYKKHIDSYKSFSFHLLFFSSSSHRFPFRQRSFTEENRPTTSAVTLHSPPSPGQSSFNRGTRETAEFCEFFFKAKKIEKDFAELTLTGKFREIKNRLD